MNKEAYAFAGLLYWIGCFSLSRFAFALEKKRAKAENH
jgi:ABC-type amino acid transport system permease subunit